MDAPVSLEYRVEGDDFLAAGEASNSIKETLKMLGVDSAISRRAAVVTYELEMNLVIHAKGGYLKANIYPQYLEIISSDTGPGIPDKTKAVQEGFSTASDRIREMGFGAGMGLPNIKRNSDKFNLDSEVGVGTTVTSRINLSAQ